VVRSAGSLPSAEIDDDVRTVLDEKLYENAGRVGSALAGRLASMVGEVPGVTEVRGRGLMLAVQLDSDLARKVVTMGLERGVVFNDVLPSAVRMLPALTLTEDEAMTAAGVLEEVLRAAAG